MFDPNNIFAKIIAGDIKSEKLYEDEFIIAINDIHPVAPVHILVIPKNPYIDFADFVAKASHEEIAHYYIKIDQIANIAGLKESGYKLITNRGAKAGQVIFHFHTHIIGGKDLKNLPGA